MLLAIRTHKYMKIKMHARYLSNKIVKPSTNILPQHEMQNKVHFVDSMQSVTAENQLTACKKIVSHVYEILVNVLI